MTALCPRTSGKSRQAGSIAEVSSSSSRLERFGLFLEAGERRRPHGRIRREHDNVYTCRNGP
jgi:hypothetical protein